MLDRFPYGKAPFVLLVIAVVSALVLVATRRAQRPADLVLAVFAEQHYVAYLAVVPKFEREHGVKVDVQLVDFQSLEARLESAIVSNTQIADLNEISEGTLGFFTRGPEADFGFMDLTERLEREGLDHRVLEARYTPWTARGHVYALPHDVHPVMLAYRRDLVEQLGIDVEALQTWDDFVAMGQRITQDLDGDGIRDRFALDLPLNGQWGLQTLLRQRGMDVFNARGEAGFNTPAGVDTLIWYLHQTRGPQRIAYEAGDSQSFYKAVSDGLVLFILTPDWRSHQFQLDDPSLSGKLALMPLPAWEKGGRRTSTWGMTGLTISKNTKNPELAWELAKFLYYNPPDLGQRFLSTNIISPLKEAWNLPEFHRPNPFFSNQRVGEEYARLAPQVPPVFTSPIYKTGQTRLDQAVARAAAYYEAHGDDGLREAVQRELADAARYLKMWSDRNGRLAQQDRAQQD